MSTANKLTYLNETKGKIKDAINLTNANILSEDTFRSYAEKLKLGLVDIINNGADDLYNSFPKTTGIGTEIALNDTYEAPMEIGLNGNTEQKILPVEYTQVDYIESSGTQYIDTNYKINSNTTNIKIDFSMNNIDNAFNCLFGYEKAGDNRFFIRFLQSGGLSAYTPNSYSVGNSYSSGKHEITFDIENSRLYINESEINISISVNSNADNFYLFTLNYKGNSAANNISSMKLYSFKIYENDNIVKNFIPCYRNSDNEVGLYDLVNDVFYTNQGNGTFTYGSIAPTPDSPIDIEVVTGDNTINIHGKNLLQITTFDDNTKTKTINGVTATINDDGSISASGTATANAVFALKKNTLNISGAFYYLCNSPSANARVELDCVVDGTRKYLNDYGNGNKQTANSSFVFNNLYVLITNGTSVDTTFKPMVALGTNVTEYQPYQGKDYEISLGNIELCKIGNYQDYLYKDDGKWYKHSEIGKVVLDGSEYWGYGGSIGVFYTTDIIDYATNNNTPYSNYYKGVSNVTGAAAMTTNKTVGFINISGGTTPRFYIKDTRYTNASDTPNLKTWLSTHNTIVYYALATPTDELITDETLIEQLEELKKAKSVNDKTYISQINEQAPFILDVSALSKN